MRRASVSHAPVQREMKRTRKQALQTRDQILDAAEWVFVERGVARTSLEDVALRAGFTRGAIYGHFRNKVELFVAMTNRVMLPMEMLVSASVDAGEPDPLGRIRQLLVFCLSKAVVEPHSRRVFEVLFTKCEHTRDTDPVFDRQRNAARNGRKQLELRLQEDNCRRIWIRFAHQASCMRFSTACCGTGSWNRIRSSCRAMPSVSWIYASACCGSRLRCGKHVSLCNHLE
jgi:AcrR family transcriptional regulator